MDTTKRQNKAIINPSKNSLPSRTSPQKVEMKKASPNNAETSRGIVKAENKNSVQNGKKHIVKRTMVIESKKKNKKPLPIGAIFTIAVTTLLFIFLLMNYAEIDDYNQEVAELRDRLTELQKDADRLEQRLDKKNDLIYFKEYALNELGMVKETELTRINITALPENIGEAFKYDDRPGGAGVLLAGIGEVIRDFFD